MSLVELLTSVQLLSRREKLQLIELIVQDLAREDNSPIAAGQSFPIGSPHDADEAAAVLMEALDNERGHRFPGLSCCLSLVRKTTPE